MKLLWVKSKNKQSKHPHTLISSHSIYGRACNAYTSIPLCLNECIMSKQTQSQKMMEKKKMFRKRKESPHGPSSRDAFSCCIIIAHLTDRIKKLIKIRENVVFWDVCLVFTSRSIFSSPARFFPHFYFILFSLSFFPVLAFWFNFSSFFFFSCCSLVLIYFERFCFSPYLNSKLPAWCVGFCTIFFLCLLPFLLIVCLPLFSLLFTLVLQSYDCYEMIMVGWCYCRKRVRVRNNTWSNGTDFSLIFPVNNEYRYFFSTFVISSVEMPFFRFALFSFGKIFALLLGELSANRFLACSKTAIVNTKTNYHMPDVLSYMNIVYTVYFLHFIGTEVSA